MNQIIQINRKTFADLRTEMTPAIALCDLLLVENYGKLNPIQKDRIQRIVNHLGNMMNIIPVISDEENRSIPDSLKCTHELIVNGEFTCCIRKKSHDGKCIFANSYLSNHD